MPMANHNGFGFRASVMKYEDANEVVENLQDVVSFPLANLENKMSQEKLVSSVKLFQDSRKKNYVQCEDIELIHNAIYDCEKQSHQLQGIISKKTEEIENLHKRVADRRRDTVNYKDQLSRIQHVFTATVKSKREQQELLSKINTAKIQTAAKIHHVAMSLEELKRSEMCEDQKVKVLFDEIAKDEKEIAEASLKLSQNQAILYRKKEAVSKIQCRRDLKWNEAFMMRTDTRRLNRLKISLTNEWLAIVMKTATRNRQAIIVSKRIVKLKQQAQELRRSISTVDGECSRRHQISEMLHNQLKEKTNELNDFRIQLSSLQKDSDAILNSSTKYRFQLMVDRNKLKDSQQLLAHCKEEEAKELNRYQALKAREQFLQEKCGELKAGKYAASVDVNKIYNAIDQRRFDEEPEVLDQEVVEVYASRDYEANKLTETENRIEKLKNEIHASAVSITHLRSCYNRILRQKTDLQTSIIKIDTSIRGCEERLTELRDLIKEKESRSKIEKFEVLNKEIEQANVLTVRYMKMARHITSYIGKEQNLYERLEREEKHLRETILASNNIITGGKEDIFNTVKELQAVVVEESFVMLQFKNVQQMVHTAKCNEIHYFKYAVRLKLQWETMCENLERESRMLKRHHTQNLKLVRMMEKDTSLLKQTIQQLKKKYLKILKSLAAETDIEKDIDPRELLVQLSRKRVMCQQEVFELRQTMAEDCRAVCCLQKTLQLAQTKSEQAAFATGTLSSMDERRRERYILLIAIKRLSEDLDVYEKARLEHERKIDKWHEQLLLALQKTKDQQNILAKLEKKRDKLIAELTDKKDKVESCFERMGRILADLKSKYDRESFNTLVFNTTTIAYENFVDKCLQRILPSLKPNAPEYILELVRKTPDYLSLLPSQLQTPQQDESS